MAKTLEIRKRGSIDTLWVKFLKKLVTRKDGSMRKERTVGTIWGITAIGLCFAPLFLPEVLNSYVYWISEDTASIIGVLLVALGVECLFIIALPLLLIGPDVWEQ